MKNFSPISTAALVATLAGPVVTRDETNAELATLVSLIASLTNDQDRNLTLDRPGALTAAAGDSIGLASNAGLQVGGVFKG